jgi:hypothetical protein
VVVIAVVIVVAAGAGILLTGPSSKASTSVSSSSSSSSSSAGVQPFIINYSQLIVGYQGGLFQIGFRGTGTVPIDGVVVVLSTPTQAAMCTGGDSLGFGNCTPGPNKSYTYTVAYGGSFAANATFSGVDTGAGPGSAVVGQSYPVSITVTYTDGTSVVQNISVQATAGS